MPNTIAGYYTDELSGWSESIMRYNQEMDELTQKLSEVIRRNSIPGIAGKVEALQEQLNKVTGKLYKLHMFIQKQEKVLKKDSALVENTLVNNETETRQSELRRKMQITEKQYIDVKFECYNFLSATLKRK